MPAAPVNKILPYSLVDGPGCRAAVFMQGCNLCCAYCHNPETQRLCSGCGACVPQCPTGALAVADGGVVWDSALCTGCDRCIKSCPESASPKVRWMTGAEAYRQVRKSMPFIRGLTVSGGECSLYPAFLAELFQLAQKDGLSCLMDTNGATDLSALPGLMELCDGVMLDVKAWNPAVYRELTGGDHAVVRKNLRWLAGAGRLAELRVVCLADVVDAGDAIGGMGEILPDGIKEAVPLKLIRFRPHGVRGSLAGHVQPDGAYMDLLCRRAQEAGFGRVVVV